jgi:hypothetical protein
MEKVYESALVWIHAVFLRSFSFGFGPINDRSCIVAFDVPGRDALPSIHYLLLVTSFDDRRHLSYSNKERTIAIVYVNP